MPIIQSIKAPNGAAVTFHRIVRFEASLPLEFLSVVVASHAIEADYLAAMPPVHFWTMSMPIPSAGGPMLATIESALVATGQPFAGGAVVSDAATTLPALRERKWAQIKLARDQAVVSAEVVTPFGTFDADAMSQDRIKGTLVALREAAAIGQAPATIAWTLADNTAVDLTPANLGLVSVLLLERGNQAFTIARVLREQINTAADTAALEGITWPT